ncbi:hypothetical protein GCM10009573_30260 [Agromyces bracchium]
MPLRAGLRSALSLGCLLVTWTLPALRVVGRARLRASLRLRSTRSRELRVGRGRAHGRVGGRTRAGVRRVGRVRAAAARVALGAGCEARLIGAESGGRGSGVLSFMHAIRTRGALELR